MEESPAYERMDWISLDNFLTTHPALKKIARWFLEHPDERVTADQFSAAYAQPTSWLDLKGLAIHKVLTPLDARGAVVEMPFVIDGTTVFRFNRKLQRLVEDVLAKVKPGRARKRFIPNRRRRATPAGAAGKAGRCCQRGNLVGGSPDGELPFAQRLHPRQLDREAQPCGRGRGDGAVGAHGNFRINEVFLPIAPAGADIAGEGEVRQRREGDVVGAPNAAFEHAATPDRHARLLGGGMHLERG